MDGQRLGQVALPQDLDGILCGGQSVLASGSEITSAPLSKRASRSRRLTGWVSCGSSRKASTSSCAGRAACASACGWGSGRPRSSLASWRPSGAKSLVAPARGLAHPGASPRPTRLRARPVGDRLWARPLVSHRPPRSGAPPSARGRAGSSGRSEDLPIRPSPRVRRVLLLAAGPVGRADLEQLQGGGHQAGASSSARPLRRLARHLALQAEHLGHADAAHSSATSSAAAATRARRPVAFTRLIGFCSRATWTARHGFRRARARRGRRRRRSRLYRARPA